MHDRTPDGTPTVDLGPSEEPRPAGDQPATPASAFDPPKERFEAVGELGRGGMGRVDDAYDRALGRPVAIKHMLSTSAVALGRFEREARITARLEHPGIVPIHDAGRGPDGTPYYVMRRVDGQPLDATIGTKLAERLALIPNVLAACDAVAFAHARGIVHRDIKPTNILIGPFGETLVIDWGLAREIGETDDGPAVVEPSDPQLTVAGTVAGTPGFMAPEQARGEAVDARADVFALGATLFYVLSGELPYGSASATEMVDLAGAGRTPNWRVIPSDVPPELRAIAVKAMASEASERYPDAGALAADLRQFITGNLVGAYDYGPVARFVRFVRRHRAAVAVALVSAIVVGVIAVLSIRRILAERDDATTARALAETRQQETASMRDRLLVEHALELANTDPIAAIAALRTLTPDSSHWREARIAAAQAYVRGIPFGFAGTSTAGFGYLQIRNDSKLAAIGDYRGGRVTIVDLVARTNHVIDTPCGTMIGVVWIGPGHVACGTDDLIAIVDITTGRTRTLPIDLQTLRGDHGSVVWITTTSHRLLELDDPGGELRELATGFDEVETSPLLDEALVRRGNTFEVWSGTTRLHFEIAGAPLSISTTMTIRDHRIVVYENSRIHAWRIEAGHLTPITGIPNRRYSGFDIIDHRIYLWSYDGVFVYDEGQYIGTMVSVGMEFRTPRGFVVALGDGEIEVIDRDGRFRIQRRASTIRRAETSIDGRFVVTLGQSGDTLVWDLERVRPKRIWIDRGTLISRLTSHYVWTQDLLDGLKRVSVTTGKIEEVVPRAITGTVLVPDNETWAGVQHVELFHVHDLTTDHQLAFETSLECEDGVGFVFVRADATLWRWRPGHDEATQLASLPHVPPELAAAGDFVVMQFEGQAIAERRRISTGALEHAPVPVGSMIGILDDGTVWARKPDGSALRWDVGGQPIGVDVGGSVNAFVTDHDRVALYTQRALMLMIGNERHFVPIESSSFAWAGHTTAVTTNAAGDPQVTDMISGLGYKLPEAAYVGVQQPVASDDRIAIIGELGLRHGDAIGVDLWTVDPPEDPAALRAWLSTITNARPIAGTTSYEWP